MIKKKLILPKGDFYKTHLEIINPILPIQLSTKEIEVLSSFMSLDDSIKDEDMFNTLARKKVMSKLGLSPGGLTNHLKSMITKNFLIKNPITKRIVVQGFLFPSNTEKQEYHFIITTNGEK